MSINPRNFIVVALGNMAVQYLAARYLRGFNVVPDLILLFIVYCALFFPGWVALLLAFTLGFYQDFLMRSPIGGHSIVYIGAAYLTSRLATGKITISRKNGFMLTGSISFLFALAYQMALTPVRSSPLFLKPLLFAMLNGILSIPAFAVYRRGLV